MYKFKEIQTVPPANDLIDIVLSKTQRHTPTVVHPGYKITRIRNFYLRKIKFVQTTYSEKLTSMMSEFPRLDEIHPFFADLCNVYESIHFLLIICEVHPFFIFMFCVLLSLTTLVSSSVICEARGSNPTAHRISTCRFIVADNFFQGRVCPFGFSLYF